MLLSREEMTFDFHGAKLDPVADRDVLAWMMNQFLYGEITGIQCGHWLYQAPTIEAARFLARQSVEELQHVDNFLRIMALLRCRPGAAHPIVRFLSTGMIGGSWPEHVALEMAMGEGFVLAAFYGLLSTIDHPGIVEILSRAVKQEERHVDFGETETLRVVAGRPLLRRHLLGLALVWMWGVRRLAGFMSSRLPTTHPVLSQLGAFVAHALFCAELRLQRLGLLHGPLAALPAWRRGLVASEAYGSKALLGAAGLLAAPLRFLPRLGKKRLTETYLGDPAIRPLPPGERRLDEGT